MKRIVILIVFGFNLTLSAQSLSCVEFVQMNEQSVEKEIQKMQNGFQLERFKTDPSLEDKAYMETSNVNTSQLSKCMHLRNSLKYNVEDARRYKALLELNTFGLSVTEKRIYMQSINESIHHFKRFSNASLVSNSCSKPLIYLTAQETNNGLMIYEHRLVNGQLKAFKKPIGSQNVQFVCGRDSSNDYYAYLQQEKGVQFSLAPKIQKEKQSMSHPTYVTQILLFKIKNFKTNKKRDIPKGSTVKVIKAKQYTNGKVDIIFSWNHKKYIVNSYRWNEAIKAKRD